MNATQDAISRTNRVFYELEQINSDYKELSITVRSYVITGDSMDLRHRDTIKSRIEASTDFLETTLLDSLSLAYLDALTEALNTRNETFGEEVIKLRKERGFREAQAFYSENDDQELIVRNIPNLTQNIKGRLAVLLDERVKLSELNAKKTVYVIVLGTLISLGLVFFVIFIFIQDQKKISLHLNEIEQKKAELQVLTNQLQSHNARPLNFSHLTSHNLRSPVNNLNSLLHLYKESQEPSEKSLFFGHIETVTRHLAETLNELMEALKIQEENAIDREWLDFEEIFQKTIETFSADILMSGALVTRDYAKVKKVEYNRSYLESIMLNLLSNAIKYKAHDRVPQVHFETFISGGSIGLTVRDNGQGIDLEKYGEKLFGLNNTFHGHAEGKGVGLYLIKTQLASQGGSISTKSVVGEGSEFKVVLF
ncbi:sensor histidine kinase [Cyclobacterium jeungdonense]|uniref:histidine kinase n=1 Tax=Cyclobacterium jeungdonense TaxID=708087 RepID=A0ABT8C7V6_9BACT|nr:ATP-binding protein [Cyclobacterium jeungdonense]MDN3688601.1 ATP-binding protein [Cyclobacterium jeungdonense]